MTHISLTSLPALVNNAEMLVLLVYQTLHAPNVRTQSVKVAILRAVSYALWDMELIPMEAVVAAELHVIIVAQMLHIVLSVRAAILPIIKQESVNSARHTFKTVRLVKPKISVIPALIPISPKMELVRFVVLLALLAYLKISVLAARMSTAKTATHKVAAEFATVDSSPMLIMKPVLGVLMY